MTTSNPTQAQKRIEFKFSSYLKRFVGLWGILTGVGSMAPLVAKFSNYAPPKDEGAAVAAAICALFMVMFSFLIGRAVIIYNVVIDRFEKRLYLITAAIFFVSLISLSLYIIEYAIHVKAYGEGDTLEIIPDESGYLPGVQETVIPGLKTVLQKETISAQDLMNSFDHDPTKIWKESAVNRIRGILDVSLLVAATFFSLCFSFVVLAEAIRDHYRPET